MKYIRYLRAKGVDFAVLLGQTNNEFRFTLPESFAAQLGVNRGMNGEIDRVIQWISRGVHTSFESNRPGISALDRMRKHWMRKLCLTVVGF